MAEYTILPTGKGITISSLDAVRRSLPSLTYRLDETSGRILGRIDGLDAVRQTVFCVLQTERYAWNIYSRNYGTELESLFGKSVDYAASELKRRIEQALSQDDRIENIDGWTFSSTKNTLSAAFTVYTSAGSFNAATEVQI